MATYLTPTAVTREAVRVLHSELNFIGNCAKQYDSSFANGGATVKGKFGPTLKIRKPNKYTVRTGMSMQAQDQTEASEDLTVSTVKGVDMYFAATDLALSIENFSERFIKPAMSTLASNIEADALSMRKKVFNLVDGDAAAFGFASVSNANEILTNMLAPRAGRVNIMRPSHANKFRQDTKGLFQDSGAIKEQWREGMIGRTSGFDNYENTLLLPHTTGTAAKTTSYTVSGAVTANGSTAVTLTGAATTWKEGDVFTVAGCNRVHPETKADTGVLQQFVVSADCTTAMTFTPALYTSGALQNVVAAGMANGVALVKVGAGASETLVESLAFHPDAFAFVTADLSLPKGHEFAAREVFDGISLSMVRGFEIADRSEPCRIDCLYGYKAIYPELAVRIHNDG